jgi:hypothetical protein
VGESSRRLNSSIRRMPELVLKISGLIAGNKVTDADADERH